MSISVVAPATVAVFVYLPAGTDSESCTTISNGGSEAPGPSGCVLAAVQVTFLAGGGGELGGACPARAVGDVGEPDGQRVRDGEEGRASEGPLFVATIVKVTTPGHRVPDVCLRQHQVDLSDHVHRR